MSALRHGFFRRGFMLCDRCVLNVKCESFVPGGECAVERRAYGWIVRRLSARALRCFASFSPSLSSLSKCLSFVFSVMLLDTAVAAMTRSASGIHKPFSLRLRYRLQ